MDNFSIFFVNSSILSLSYFFLRFSLILFLRKFSFLSILLAILNAYSILSGSFSYNFYIIDNFNACLYINKIILFRIWFLFGLSFLYILMNLLIKVVIVSLFFCFNLKSYVYQFCFFSLVTYFALNWFTKF